MLRNLIATLALLASATSCGDDIFIGSYYAVVVRDIRACTARYESPSTCAWYPIGRGRPLRDRETARTGSPCRTAGGLERCVQVGGLVQGPFKVGVLVADRDRFIDQVPAAIPWHEASEDAAKGLTLVRLRDPDGNIVELTPARDVTGSL